MKELKDVVGYEGLYKITEYGDIYNRFNHKSVRKREIDLSKKGKKRKFCIDRLVLSTYGDNHLYNKGYGVVHIDGDKTNNHIDNLSWCVKHTKVSVYDKRTKKTTIYTSLIKASKAIYQNPAYISHAIINGRCENDRYKWSVVYD